MKKYWYYREVGAINLVRAKEKLEELQEVISPYINQNLHNINESELF